MADQLGDVLPEALAEAIGDFFDGDNNSNEGDKRRCPSATPVVPVRHTYHVWKVREAWRGFLLFTLSALSWALLQHNRVDGPLARRPPVPRPTPCTPLTQSMRRPPRSHVRLQYVPRLYERRGGVG